MANAETVGVQWDLRRALARTDHASAGRAAGPTERTGAAWPGLRGGRKERMNGSCPARMPAYGAGFRGCGPGLYAPVDPAIPIAPLLLQHGW